MSSWSFAKASRDKNFEKLKLGGKYNFMNFEMLFLKLGRKVGTLSCFLYLSRPDSFMILLSSSSSFFHLSTFLAAAILSLITFLSSREKAHLLKRIVKIVLDALGFGNTKFGEKGTTIKKHLKNCECCPVSLLTVR